MGSPKSTLRKPMMGHHHGGVNSETLFQVRWPRTKRKLKKINKIFNLFQFQPDGYNPPRDGFRGRDNFGTLRSHQGENYRRDGFSTTRSVKKVYLWDGTGAADNQNINQTNNLSNNLNNHHHSNNQQHSMNIISSNSDKSNNLNSQHRSHHHHSNSNSSHGTNRMRTRPPRQHVHHRSDSPQNSSGSGSSPTLSHGSGSSSSPAPPSSPSLHESPKNCSYIYRDWLQFNTTPPSLMNSNKNNSTTSPAATASTSSMSPSKVKSTMANTLQPKKSSNSSPLSKIKFHSISKRRFSGQKMINLNEKFQLINKKHGTSSSSFIGSDDYDYINYGTGDKSSGSGGKSSSLKKYFLKFAGDKTSDSNSLEAKNLFHLKRHHHYHSQASAGGRASTSDENDFDVLNF